MKKIWFISVQPGSPNRILMAEEMEMEMEMEMEREMEMEMEMVHPGRCTS
jgi:hypothetical protein